MRDYAKLSPFFWTRGSGKRLRGNPDAQVVAMYLSTSPAANMIGIYHVSVATIANDTGLPEKRVRAALAAVEKVQYAYFDEDAELAWVPNHAKFEIGDEMRPGDKRRSRVYAELAQVKGTKFENAFRHLYSDGYGLEPPTEGASKGHPLTIADTEGASASGEQDRTGQDIHRTGQVSRPASPEAEPVTQVRDRRKPETPCPDLDSPAEAVDAWASGWKIPTDHPEFPRFLVHHQKNDKRWRNWSASWRQWLDNAPLFARGSPAGRHVQSATNRAWIVPKDMP